MVAAEDHNNKSHDRLNMEPFLGSIERIENKKKKQKKKYPNSNTYTFNAIGNHIGQNVFLPTSQKHCQPTHTAATPREFLIEACRPTSACAWSTVLTITTISLVPWPQAPQSKNIPNNM